jgi:hypothetical protein
MDLTSVGEYLVGKSFSNSLKVPIAQAERTIPYRMECIERIVEKKDVIHFGCADHVEIIQYKIDRNLWFHKRLMSCANKCIGIDNNPQAVDFLKSKLHIPDVYCFDIEKNDVPSEILAGHYDYLILGEIIEHVDNPVQFLQILHCKFAGFVDNIIITAPNAFSWNNFKYVFKHMELINSDHRFWFTPYTLSKVLFRAGYHEANFQLVENYRREKLPIIKKILFCRFPSFRDTVLIKAKF